MNNWVHALDLACIHGRQCMMSRGDLMLTLLDAMHGSQLLACQTQLGRAAACPHGTMCCRDGIASCCSPVVVASWRTLMHRRCKPLMWLASPPPAPPYVFLLTVLYQISLYQDV